MDRSSNASNGPEAMDAQRKKIKATSHTRGTKQKKGSMTRHKARQAKFQKRDNSGPESLDEMEF